MLKAAALGVDVLILVAVGAYFVTEGFGRNLVLDIFLALVGTASVVVLVGVIRSGNRPPQRDGDVAQPRDRLQRQKALGAPRRAL